MTWTIKVALQKPLMTLFRQSSDRTIKVALQNYNKSSTIDKTYKKKNELDHNLNIELSILNIKKSTISVFSD